MYFSRRSTPVLDRQAGAAAGEGTGPGRWRRLLVAPNVALLGMTSLVTDVSSEMVSSVLPLYLTVRLGFSALQFGATDGLMGLATALTGLMGALLADRWRRYREVAGTGYGLSAVSRLGLRSARGWFPVLGWLATDRFGKGIRTGPRDALISLSAPPGRLGEAFGLHRMLDTGGALAGPLLAVVLLSVAPGSYGNVFLASFFIAVSGLAILVLFVENRSAHHAGPAPRLWSPLRSLWSHRLYRRVLVATALLSIAAVSDSFLFLTLRRRVSIDQRWFPLLFVAESVVYLVLAVPCGRLADRWGAGRVLLAGQLALAGSYALLIASPGTFLLLVGVPALLGAFFAATDGVLSALASHVVPAPARTTSLAILGIVLAGGRAVAAAGFGMVWLGSGPHRALVDATGALVVGGLVAAMVLSPLLVAAPGGTGAPDASPAGDGRAVAAPEAVVSEPGPGRRRRLAAFLVVAAVCVSSVVGFTVQSARRIAGASRRSSARLAESGAAASPGGSQSQAQRPVDLSGSLAVLAARPHLLVRDTTEGADFDRLEIADLADPAGPRALTGIGCARADQVAGRGLCLVARPSSNSRILVFDGSFKVLAALEAYGTPSRARVAPNGRVGAETTFVNGDSYNVDNFSTRTEFVDLMDGKVVADLESFHVSLGGRPLHPIDQNFWGVTFAADSDTFYATMRTGSHFYLIRGHLRTGQAEVLRDGVECPAISPDGTRLAYKSRVEHGFDPATWRLRVMDLATLADHPLAETRNVDDQAAWLDDAHVLYGVPEIKPGSAVVDTWSVPADGSGPAVLQVPSGDSPVVVPAPPGVAASSRQ